MDSLMYVVLYIIILVYFVMFYIVLLSNNSKRRRIKQFYNAICSIYENTVSSDTVRNSTYDDALEQVILNFNQISKSTNRKNKYTLTDMLEQIIHHHDSFSSSNFTQAFGSTKNIEIRNFAFVLRNKLIAKDPFSSLPAKEATLLKSLKDAIGSNNADLANVTLEQLSTEIFAKENLIQKQSTDNQLTTIISIVGLVLTIFFGILSLN